MTRQSRAELREELLSRLPRWYTPWLHLAFPAASGLGIAAFALSRVEGLRAWQLACVPLFLAFGNAVEWHAHRGLLHRRTRFLEVLYVRHTPQHHAVYVADDMAIRSARELALILLPAYGVLALLALTSPIALAFFGLGQPNLAALWVATVVSYVLGYEWLHLAYHLPEQGRIGRLWLVQALRRHHQLHHAPQLMQRWNFNVTVPLWDLVRGTSYRAPGASVLPGALRRQP
ncbi:sterol desaturase family protein [Anaeromyxobacter oryzisoli]|uniref:sterol desaturase family protein n=1 Tax=Anaeromyxobacter oryzisoli TaxID=2925408 RepID=UPI001F58920C|nr:sterol desaturase family protein [Anaeromyxobacter sp. SG63]